MTLRCPHCKSMFAELRDGRCPQCGKGLRLLKPAAPASDAAAAAKARRARRARREAEEAEARTNRSPWLIPMAFVRYRSRIFLWALVVAAVIAGKLLFTKVNPGQVREPDRTVQTRRELGVLRTALEWYRADCRAYPSTEAGLKALVRNPGVAGWHGHYIEGLPPDLWGRPYQYAFTNGTVRLYGLGPDGKDGTADDVRAPEPDWRELLKRIKVGDLPRWPSNAVERAATNAAPRPAGAP